MNSRDALLPYRELGAQTAMDIDPYGIIHVHDRWNGPSKFYLARVMPPEEHERLRREFVRRGQLLPRPEDTHAARDVLVAKPAREEGA